MAKKELTEQQKQEFKEQAKQKLNAFTQDVSRKVVDMILKGATEKWERPWKTNPLREMPYNPVSGHRFSGGNALALYMHLLFSGESDPRYCTFKQAKKIGEGTHVKKGAEGIYILRPIILKKNNEPADDLDPRDTQGQDSEEEQEIVFFRPTKIFHASQIENMPALENTEPLEERKWNDHAMIERLVTASNIPLTHGYQKAAYFPGRDVIRMPDKNAFSERGGYYATLLHEWMHATGHSRREERNFGSTLHFNGLKEYAQEELRAETFSAMASMAFGIPYKLTTGADYIKLWNDKIDSDPKEIFAQAAYAAKMLEVVMDFSQDQQPKVDWFPDKSTWPPVKIKDDLEEAFQIDASEVAAFDPDDPFAELDDMDFDGPQM